MKTNEHTIPGQRKVTGLTGLHAHIHLERIIDNGGTFRHTFYKYLLQEIKIIVISKLRMSMEVNFNRINRHWTSWRVHPLQIFRM